jgi:hypothetical protein
LGCGSETSTAAPKVEGKARPDWKNMSKEEKIKLIQGQPIPEQAKADAIKRIEQGID